jgi:hypothetical protein
MDWDMLQVASENNIDEYIEKVTEFIRKCLRDVVPTVTVKTYPNQKLWIDGSIRAQLKARTTTFNHGKVTGNMANRVAIYTNRVVIPPARQSNRQNISIETKWSLNSMAQTRNVCGRVYRQPRTTKGKPATSRTPTSFFQTF